MNKIAAITHFVDNFSDFQIPVLVAKDSPDGKLVNTNNEFKKLFTNTKEYVQDTIFSKIFDENNQNINLNGCCYHIDKVSSSDSTTFFFTPNNNLSIDTIQWIRHELFNILNPIMGFSDYLLESENIKPDELELIGRIHSNARKMFNIIDQANLFQTILNRTEAIEAVEYSVYDFILELSDSLLIKGITDKACGITIQDNANVRAYIANHNLRTILENHIINLLSFQIQKSVDFNISKKESSIFIEINLGSSQLPTNYLNDIIKIENTFKNCLQIERLDKTGLNYILLLLLLDNLNSQITTLINNDNTLHIKLIIPIATYLETTSSPYKTHPKDNYSQKKFANDIPKELYHKLYLLFIKLGNINLLDNWEELAQKFELANTKHQNKAIENTIQNIRKSIKIFDILELKKIHTKLSLIFENVK